MAEAHFNAKFRFMKAKNKTSDRAPDYNLVMDYTVEEAKKAAEREKIEINSYNIIYELL